VSLLSYSFTDVQFKKGGAFFDSQYQQHGFHSLIWVTPDYIVIGGSLKEATLAYSKPSFMAIDYATF